MTTSAIGSFDWFFLDAEALVVLVIGALCACLALLLGRRFLMRQGTVVAAGPTSPITTSAAPGKPKLDTMTNSRDIFLEGSSDEKRIAARRGGNHVDVRLFDLTSKAQLTEGFVLDRSAGGICLQLLDAVPEGIVVSMRPQRATEMLPGVEVEIRSCRPLKDGWEVGCRFVRTPPWSVLLHFG
jgi:hypothetical protein